MSKSRTVLYLYGITKDAAQKSLRATGVDGASPLEPLRCDGFFCWISRVDAAEFADNLSRNMEDLEWLAAAGVRHQRAVAEIAAQADILPARFGTVFLTEQSLADDVKKNKRALTGSLKRITGADEWGIKVFAAARRRPAAVTAASGREYLQKKAAARQAKTREMDPEVEEFATQLAKLADGIAPAGKVSSGQRELEWQASFLLKRSRRKQWQQVLDRFARRWRDRRRIECTGPWPPYSFVSTHGR